MDRVDQRFGRPNVKAPSALSQSAFLIGQWQCEARVKTNGDWQTFQVSWLGRYILDGYAIKEPVAAPTLARTTYTNLSTAHFTWRGEIPGDSKDWSEFMVFEAHRSEDQETVPNFNMA